MTETVTIEKEVLKSVLRVNCNKIDECERLQKQLNIAIHVLEKYANRDFEEYNPNVWDRGNAARKALICIKVEELNK